MAGPLRMPVAAATGCPERLFMANRAVSVASQMDRHGGMDDVLSRRALNRALLERQGLRCRWQLPASVAIERLVGMQAQAPLAPYVGLWTRLEDFKPDELARLLVERGVVRSPLMRATIHLVTGRDCLALHPVMQPALARVLAGTSYARGLADIDVDALLVTTRALLADRPRTLAEFRTDLAKQFPGYDAASLASATQFLIPLVQVPPRGVWGRGGRATWTTVEHWLGAALDASTTIDDVVLRYLVAFGPATVADVRMWSGLAGLQDVVERLRPNLRAFRDEHGRELLDQPDAPLPDPETPVPVRYLPEFDNVLLAHADRTRIISDGHRRRMITKNGLVRGGVLVDGFVCGQWKVDRERGAATLNVELFEPITKADKNALVEEGERLLAFAAGDARSRDIQFTVA
jgi:hypothetical protein